MQYDRGMADAGTRKMIGTYPIERELGRGGMGVVYLCRDTRLDRAVAVKVLPRDFARDPMRLARFEREARSLAAMNHPNVAAIYSIDSANEETLLVLEYVPGRTLSDVLMRGPMAIDEAMRVALQICEGIEAAHERNVVHRDLKPDNVRVTPEGLCKILDFGLATGAAGEDEPASAPSVSESATTRLTGFGPGGRGPALTQYGMVMGTPGYMSPEQARGTPVDKRTDIWAFGCILFEILSGTKAFHGDTTSDCIAAVIDKEPDWSMLPVTTPNRLRELMRRCLTKDARRRLRDIGDARIEIEDVLSQPMSGLYRAASADGSGPGRTRVVARLTLKLPEHAPLANTPKSGLAIAPDGSAIAYVSGGGSEASLVVRRMEEMEAKAVPGAQGAEQPFFSPDSQKLAFFSGGRLRRASLSGGVPSVVAPAPRAQGGVWDPTDRVFYVPDFQSGIVRIPASGVAAPGGAAGAVGGEMETVAKPDHGAGQVALLSPDMLPGGRHALCSIWTGTGYDDALIGAVDVRTGAVRVLVQGGANPRFALSGHLLFTRKSSLMAVAFDPDRLEVFGQPQVVVEGVLSNALGGGAQVAVSTEGTLVYAPGVYFEPEASVLVAHRGTGVGVSAPGAGSAGSAGSSGVLGGSEAHALLSERRAFVSPALAPDGSALAVQVQGQTDHVWVYDLQRGGSPMRLTFQGDNSSPVWFPDSRRVAIAVRGGERQEIRAVSLDALALGGAGGGAATGASAGSAESSGGAASAVLVSSALAISPCAITPDGKRIVYTQSKAQGGTELWGATVGDPSSAVCLVPAGAGFGNAWGGAVSPDGRLLAFVSDQTGRAEVYVQALVFGAPGTAVLEPAHRWQVSRDGGAGPRFSRDGGELYYRSGETLIAVRVNFDAGGAGVGGGAAGGAGGGLMVGRPRPMLTGKFVEATASSANYDVFPDGDRIVVLRRAEEPAPARELSVVLNFFAELSRKAPVPQVSRPSTYAQRSGVFSSSMGSLSRFDERAGSGEQRVPGQSPKPSGGGGGGFNSSAGTIV